jgi:hypothetical protein
MMLRARIWLRAWVRRQAEKRFGFDFQREFHVAP